MGLTGKDLCQDSPQDPFLGYWHANIIYIDGKKYIQFVNDKTLFNFIIPDLPRNQI